MASAVEQAIVACPEIMSADMIIVDALNRARTATTTKSLITVVENAVQDLINCPEPAEKIQWLLKSELMNFDRTYAGAEKAKRTNCFNALDSLCHYFDAYCPGSKGIGW